MDSLDAIKVDLAALIARRPPSPHWHPPRFHRGRPLHLEETEAFLIGDDDGERPVTLFYTARPGSSATWYEPADPAEFEIWFVSWADPDTGLEVEITDAITQTQIEAWDEWLYERHDFDPPDYGDEW